MLSAKEIKNINQTEILKIFNKLAKEEAKVNLDVKRKYVLTINTYEVFFRLYIDKDIKVFIRTNTLNLKETVMYDFVDYKTTKIEDEKEYKNIINLYFKNIVKEVLNVTYCPEHHYEMIPSNASQYEIDKGWYTIYERRLLQELSYNDLDNFNKWLELVTDKKYIKEQRKIIN